MIQNKFLKKVILSHKKQIFFLILFFKKDKPDIPEKKVGEKKTPELPTKSVEKEKNSIEKKQDPKNEKKPVNDEKDTIKNKKESTKNEKKDKKLSFKERAMLVYQVSPLWVYAIFFVWTVNTILAFVIPDFDFCARISYGSCSWYKVLLFISVVVTIPYLEHVSNVVQKEYPTKKFYILYGISILAIFTSTLLGDFICYNLFYSDMCHISSSGVISISIIMLIYLVYWFISNLEKKELNNEKKNN